MPLTLAAHNLDFTETFYRDLLEQPLRRTLQPGAMPVLELPATEPWLRFVPLAVFQRRHPLLLETLDRKPLGQGLLLQLETPNLRRILSRLRREGIQLLYELEDEEHRRREIWLYDPDHYLVALSGPL